MKKIFLNWKQNGDFTKIANFKNNVNKQDGVVLFVPHPYLTFASSIKYDTGSQNVSAFLNGAFTGEVGASMLKNCKVKYCLVGHSERRKFFNETNQELSSKIKILKSNSIIPVLCIGETLLERKNGTFLNKLKKQMEIYESGVLVAYEPVWSIGTGLVPTHDEIAEISKFLNINYSIQVLYGGSVSSKNAKSILSIKNISGLLIGGASLKYEEVNKILDENSRN